MNALVRPGQTEVVMSCRDAKYICHYSQQATDIFLEATQTMNTCELSEQ